MGDGVDLALAALIAEWRLAHPEATLDELFESFAKSRKKGSATHNGK